MYKRGIFQANYLDITKLISQEVKSGVCSMFVLYLSTQFAGGGEGPEGGGGRSEELRPYTHVNCIFLEVTLHINYEIVNTTFYITPTSQPFFDH